MRFDKDLKRLWRLGVGIFLGFGVTLGLGAIVSFSTFIFVAFAAILLLTVTFVVPDQAFFLTAILLVIAIVLPIITPILASIISHERAVAVNHGIFGNYFIACEYRTTQDSSDA